MAKFSKKQGGKEVGGASVYAQPHTMSGKAVGISSTPGGNPVRRVSLGDITREPKSTGIVTRGNGAATKGITARGPMA